MKHRCLGCERGWRSARGQRPGAWPQTVGLDGSYPAHRAPDNLLVACTADVDDPAGALANLGHCLQVAAGLELSWNISRRFDTVDHDADAHTWYPGCGIAYDHPTVTCVWCEEPYPAISVEHRQGSDCCAWFYQRDGKWWLTGGYGSCEADMGLFAVGQAVSRMLDDHLTERDPVCDHCIRRMVDNGDLVRVGETTLEGDHRVDDRRGRA